MAKTYAGAVIWREVDGVRQYLVIDTRSTHPNFPNAEQQTKFVGGTEQFHDHEDKNILDTLRRELREETGMCLPLEYYPLLIHSVPLEGHFKNFYDIPFSALSGNLRTIEITVEHDWMSVPHWITMADARRLYGHHYTAIQKSDERYRTKLRAA